MVKAPSPDDTNVPPSTSPANKKLRLRFSVALDVTLLKAVLLVDAHIAPHGENWKRFQDVERHFMSAISPSIFATVQEPTWKSLKDRCKKVMLDHREAVKKNIKEYGIIKVRGEREDLLDDIIFAVDEFDEAKRAQRDERTALYVRLRAAGEEIRNSALGHGSTSSNQDEAEVHAGAGSSGTYDGSTPKINKRTLRVITEDEEGRELFIQSIKSREELELKRLRLNQERLKSEKEERYINLEYQKERNEIDIKCIELERKRIELMERRYAFYREGRKVMIEESKQLPSLLGIVTHFVSDLTKERQKKIKDTVVESFNLVLSLSFKLKIFR